MLYGASTSLPGLLQSLFGYDATSSGFVMSPSGIFSVMMLPLIGILLGRGADARWIIIVGLLAMGAGCYWMALMNLEISPSQVVWPRVVMIVGLSMIFAPINVAAYMYMPKTLRGRGRGIVQLDTQRRGGASARRWRRRYTSGAINFHALRLNEDA